MREPAVFDSDTQNESAEEIYGGDKYGAFV